MIRLSGIVLALIVPVSAVSAGGDDSQAVRGQAIVERHCARCHATGRVGDSPFVAAPPFRHIVNRYPVEYLEETFAEGTSVGHPAMPSFQFAPDQIEDLLTYLDSLAR